MATVFVVGAGPAGLFAAQKLAQAGHETIVFNRDIKPGGLAEYGIYPLKDKMKTGLRKQFSKVLALPNLHYFGHVPVGANSAVNIEMLREFCPSAMVFSVGAQGTKNLGLPGEEALGVYSAKDFVYYYNRLPPFATQDFSVGKRVAIVGMGNVMVDIARWLMVDSPHRCVEEVTVIARRGPLEAKFDDKEFANIQIHLDRRAFAEELRRVEGAMKAVGQDVAKVADETFTILAKSPDAQTVPPHLKFRFLSSPAAIIPGPDGRIARLVVTENILVARDDGVSAKATDKTVELDVDTLIFAIGDQHDPLLGLPYGPSGYVTSPDSTNPGSKFEVFDPAGEAVRKGDFVVGWARKASEGLVGIARHDGEVGAAHVVQFLQSAPGRASASADEIVRRLAQNGVQLVPKGDLRWLTAAEEREAQARGVAYYFFPDDDSMFAAIDHERSLP
jgi:ferredoxin/flavodoxin---NADP+ reductase